MLTSRAAGTFAAQRSMRSTEALVRGPARAALVTPPGQLRGARSWAHGRVRTTRAERWAATARGGRLQKEMDEMEEERSGRAKLPAQRKPRGFAAPQGPSTPPRLLPVLLYPDARLRAPNAPVAVSPSVDKSIAQLARDMFHTMYMTEGIGLAAPQVGHNICMMVYNEAGAPGEGREVVLLNPRISAMSREEEFFEEGCLSFPAIYADVKRPVGVKVEYYDLQGRKQQMELDGLEARVFQHEFDHLGGVLFPDRMDADNMAKIKADLERMEAAAKKA